MSKYANTCHTIPFCLLDLNLGKGLVSLAKQKEEDFGSDM